MKPFNMVCRMLLVGALLGSKVAAKPAESSTAAGTGVVSVAPQQSELGADWGERNVIFAVDPLEQPTEYVNTVPVKDPTKRASSMRKIVREALSMNGSVGMTEIWYGHSGNILELVISRYPDQQALDKRWKELSAKFDAKAVAPKVGQTAAWLDNGAGAGRQFVFVFRQGLYTGWVECRAELSGQPLMQLATVTSGKMAKIAEPGASPNAAPPHR